MKFHHFRLPSWKDLYGYLWKKSPNGLPPVKIFPMPMFLIAVDVGADSSRGS